MLCYTCINLFHPVNLSGPYPPMPKLLVSKRGRIAYPEEDEPVSEEEQVVVTPSKKKKKERSATGDNIAAGDWERVSVNRAIQCE